MFLNGPCRGPKGTHLGWLKSHSRFLIKSHSIHSYPGRIDGRVSSEEHSSTQLQIYKPEELLRGPPAHSQGLLSFFYRGDF